MNHPFFLKIKSDHLPLFNSKKGILYSHFRLSCFSCCPASQEAGLKSYSAVLLLQKHEFSLILNAASGEAA